jgi:hypothetical protein
MSYEADSQHTLQQTEGKQTEMKGNEIKGKERKGEENEKIYFLISGMY